MAVSGIVLAGGKGLRLGHDKILETIGNRSLLEQVVSIVGKLSQEVIIVTAEKRIIPQFKNQLNLRTVTDIYPDKGPLGGVYTGLTVSASFYNLVAAADMPFLNQDLLRYMIKIAAEFDLVVPRINSFVEPLHAVYTRNCLAPIKKMLEQGVLSLNKLFQTVNVRYVEAEEIDRFDPEHMSFFNINTRADLEMARRLSRSLEQ